MDYHAFDKLSYGLYIVSSEAGGKAAGCIVNTLGQVTVSPVQVAVTINKENQTTRTILESGKVSATGLAESASMEQIGRFGFQCSRDVDKFAGFAWARDINGVPYVTEQCAARFACTVVNEVDLGTHILFVARVDDWAVLDDVPQMTYDYYHAVKKGLTPPKASSYRPPEEKVTAPAWPERAGAGGYFSVLAKLRRQTPERVYSQPSGTEMEGATAQAAYSP